MAAFVQEGRLLQLSTPLGKDKLIVERLSGVEAIDELFEFQLDLLYDASSGSTVDFNAVLGQLATVTLATRESTSDLGDPRFINGIINKITQGAEARGTSGNATYVRCRATLVPKVWLLSRVTQSRIFQQISVPDILKEVFTGYDVVWEIQGSFEKRDYCTQYRETDFDFACRLMEEEGIFYYFKHSDGAHQMVVANTAGTHKALPNKETMIYDTLIGGNRPEDRIHGWEKTQEIRSGKTTRWDHCFELPSQNLEAVETIQGTVTVGSVSHSLTAGGGAKLERYDYPGLYAQRFDGINPGGGERSSDVQKIFPDSTRTTKIRMEQEAAQAMTIRAQSDCREACPGFKFNLTEHFDADGEYVLTRVEHLASMVGVYTSDVDHEVGYANAFSVIPSGLPYRPQLKTKRAAVAGTQTATVVGPNGEEIFTDKYSRVKVQFHWDRDGQHDDNSSCWVRVSTLWAGKQWGMIHIPRIGQEVIVDFEEGDPDRPLILGSVYNAEQMPPYKLPDNRTQSGMKSRSSLKGSEENFNELRFEDKKGEEQVYFHAEKNFDRVVENNDTLKVGFEKKDDGNQTIEIFNNQANTIGAGKGETKDGSQTLSVWNTQDNTIGAGKGQAKDGSQKTSIWKDRTTTLETGNDTLTIKQGNQTISIKMGNQSTKLDLGKSETEAMQSIELKVGQSSIKLDQTGVTIKGMMVSVEGQMQTEVKGLMTTVDGSAMLTLKGGVTMIN